MSKGQAQYVGIILFIVFIIILFNKVLPEFQAPADLAINIQQQQLVEGQDLIMFYKITNNKDEPLQNVEITNYIYSDSAYYQDSAKNKQIGTLDAKKSFSDTYIFNTHGLTRGNYRVMSYLQYSYQDKSYSTNLTLQFEVFNR